MDIILLTIGVGGFLLTPIGFLLKNDRQLKLTMSAGSFLWATDSLLRGAVSGGFVIAAIGLRQLVSAYSESWGTLQKLGVATAFFRFRSLFLQCRALGTNHPETHRAEDHLRSLMSARMQQPSAKQSGVSVEMGCAENDQSTSFMNATLQGAGNDLAISIATHIDIPEAVSARGEQAVAQHLKGQLSSAANACPGLSFSVQVGPSDSAVKARPKNRP